MSDSEIFKHGDRVTGHSRTLYEGSLGIIKSHRPVNRNSRENVLVRWITGEFKGRETDPQACILRHVASIEWAQPSESLYGRRYKVMYKHDGQWHQKYSDAAGVDAALADAREIDPNAYAVQTS